MICSFIDYEDIIMQTSEPHFIFPSEITALYLMVDIKVLLTKKDY